MPATTPENIVTNIHHFFMHQIITERVKWPQVELVISLVEGKRDRDVLYGIENCIVDSKSYGNTTIITLEYGLKMISAGKESQRDATVNQEFGHFTSYGKV
uniref:Uncharacterized protein n=1 Tax=Onchocerca volvulus TaxID=6282 RepID=A0A8R1TUS0_ONCVO